jgi:hypothetical protein
MAALAALLCASRAAASTVVEPIARFSLEGGYDTNPAYDGRNGEQTGRVSPEVGLRLHAPLWDLRTTYGGELVYFQQLAPDGIWNHRGAIELDARPTRRTRVDANLRASQAFDPAGLAHVGVFRTGREEALIVAGNSRLDWRATRRIDTALTMTERLVRFNDDTGGAMHAPGAEALWRFGPRLAFGASYGFGLFQEFVRAAPDETAFSHSLRARGRWRATRHVSMEASAGPALWLPDGDSSVVPEASFEVVVGTRGFDLRAGVAHRLGIGATARPGIVDSLEFGVERRFGRRYIARGAGGLWRSGTVPSRRDSITGYALEGEGGVVFGDVRLSLVAAHFGRVEEATTTDFQRTTVGLRMGWELDAVRRRGR